MGGTMRWAELRMCRFWAGGISNFPFSRAREYRLLRRLIVLEPYVTLDLAAERCIACRLRALASIH
jgi:hypothetical protein